MLLFFSLSAFLVVLLAFFMTASVWRRGFRWWETTIIFMLCNMGIVAAAIIFMLFSAL